MPYPSRGGGISLTKEQEDTFKYFEYNPVTNKLDATRTIATEPSSIDIGNHTISSGGENVFFTNRTSSIDWFPTWTGIKDQSILANQDETGIIAPSNRHYTPNIEVLLPNGAPAASGVVNYEIDTLVGVNVDIFSQEVIVEENIDPEDFIMYEQRVETDADPVIYQQVLTGQDLNVGDVFIWNFEHPVELRNGTQAYASMKIAKGSQDATYNLLKVRQGTTVPGERYVKVNIRIFDDARILSAMGWSNATEYSIGDWIIEGSHTLPLTAKIYVANTAGFQSGNFASNASKWDVLNGEGSDDSVLNSDTSTAPMQFVIDEDNMISDSPTKVPTQQSVKAYIDARSISNLNYKGGYDAATNIPDLTTVPTGALVGDFYTVTVDGNFFSVAVEVGDAMIAEKDDPQTENDWTILNRNLGAESIKILYESNSDTNAFTDAEKTTIGNQSGTNTGDQDLSGFALKSNVLELDNNDSFTPSNNYEPATKKYVDDNIVDISAKADRDGDDLINATINTVSLKTNQGAAKFLDGNGNYNEVPAVFGELTRSSNGNQQLTTTKSKLDFNVIDGNFTMPSYIDDRIVINNNMGGHYRVSLVGTAILKKNSEHRFYFRVNGVAGSDIEVGCIEVPEDNYCYSLSVTKIMELANNDYVEVWAKTQSNKDFKMQIGISFSAVKL